MPAGPHVWVTSAARGPTSRVSWLYAHISKLPDDSSRIIKIPVVHAHHADRILRHALLAFRSFIHYSRISGLKWYPRSTLLANAIEFPDDYRAVFTLPEKITAMLTTGMIRAGEFHLSVVARRAAGIMQHAAGLGFAAVLGTPICKRERALDGGAVA